PCAFFTVHFFCQFFHWQTSPSLRTATIGSIRRSPLRRAWGNGFLHCKKINLLLTDRIGKRRSGACTRDAILQMLFSILSSFHQLLDVLVLVVHQSADFIERQCAVHP